MQLLDKYLSDVEGHLRTLPPSIREGEVNEMAGHLQSLRADFVAQGRSVEEAEALAMARFGSARKAGLRMRDVWEGNRGAWMTFFAVFLSNWLIQVASFLGGLRFFLSTLLPNIALVEPLAPLIVLWMWSMALLLPFGINYTLGIWSGRRVLLSAPLVYLPLLATPRAGFAGFSIGAQGTSLSFTQVVLVMVAAATLGAWAGSAEKRRQRFALIGGASLEEASARLLERRKLHLRRVLVRASTCALAVGAIGAASFTIIKARVDAVLRPSTPEAAVRTMLQTPSPHFNEMAPSTDISTRLLPATPQELQKNERRVSYTATMHATEEYRKRRVKYLQQELKRELGRGNAEYARPYRDSIARLKPEGYTISRTVRVRSTPVGWKIIERGRANESPLAWLYDVYYER